MNETTKITVELTRKMRIAGKLMRPGDVVELEKADAKAMIYSKRAKETKKKANKSTEAK